ncbi:MAG: hypothetical protein IJM14_10995 [Lachnospiraceae bacterium]|nr:hypothetical protein [Lachnospiraceae bacterium]
MFRESIIKDSEEKIYREYITLINETEVEKQTSCLEELIAESETLISKRSEMDESYSYGSISFDEYHDYNKKEEKARKSLAVLYELLEKSRAYDEMRTKGKKPEFFYDKEEEAVRKALLKKEYYIVAVLIVIASNFSFLDKENRMDEFVQSSSQAGRKLHVKRILVMAAFVFFSWMFLWLGEMFSVKYICGNDILNIKLYSLLAYSKTNTKLSIIGFFRIVFATKLIVMWFWSLTAYCLSLIIKNRIICLFLLLSAMLLIF